MLDTKTVLIIENADSVRHFMRHILTSAGYRVYDVSNGSQALEIANEFTFDAVFVDIQIPDEDGIEIIRQLHHIEDYETVPIFAVTMSTADANKHKGEEAGITGWITKPIAPPALIDPLRKLLVSESHHDDRAIGSQ